MYLTASESRCLSRLFGLLAEDMAEHEVRKRVGDGLLDLLRADYFASYVWDDAAQRFDGRVTLNMNEARCAATRRTTSSMTRSPSSYRRGVSRRS